MRNRFVAAICSAFIGLAMVSTQAFADQKTVKACQDEWRANRADNTAKGITQKDYVAKCRADSASVQPKTAPGPSTPATAAPQRKSTDAPAAKTAPTGANQFQTEAQAKARCPSDTVVWVNLSSKIYHYASYADYGKTKRGAYICERDTAAGGFRAAKNEKHP